MKLSLDEKILDLSGNQVLTPDGQTLTLANVLSTACVAPLESDRSMSGEEKAKLFEMALKVVQGNSEFSIEDVAVMKRRIGMAYSPIVVGRSWKLLEG